MKVRELIERLQAIDPELEVLKQRDDEGNGYTPVFGADDACFVEADSLKRPWNLETVYLEEEKEEYLGDPVQIVVIY